MINSLLLDDVAAVKDDFAAEFVGLLLDFITFHSSLFTSCHPFSGFSELVVACRGFAALHPCLNPFVPSGLD